MGAAAVEALLDGQRNIMVGIINDKIVYVPFTQAIRDDKPLDPHIIRTLQALSI
jgi:6-phosphofructokinase 1